MITMSSDLSVDTCVTILGTCPAEYVICGKLIEFHFGGPRDGFNFAFDADALRKLVNLSSEALAQMDVPPTEERAASDSNADAGEPVGAGERPA